MKHFRKFEKPVKDHKLDLYRPFPLRLLVWRLMKFLLILVIFTENSPITMYQTLVSPYWSHKKYIPIRLSGILKNECLVPLKNRYQKVYILPKFWVGFFTTKSANASEIGLSVEIFRMYFTRHWRTIILSLSQFFEFCWKNYSITDLAVRNVRTFSFG